MPVSYKLFILAKIRSVDPFLYLDLAPALSLIHIFRVMDQAFYPIMIITQTIPTIAIAPILVLWMGFGMAPKITLVVITTFFPITIGLLDGYKSVDPDAIRLMLSLIHISWNYYGGIFHGWCLKSGIYY